MFKIIKKSTLHYCKNKILNLTQQINELENENFKLDMQLFHERDMHCRESLRYIKSRDNLFNALALVTSIFVSLLVWILLINI